MSSRIQDPVINEGNNSRTATITESQAVPMRPGNVHSPLVLSLVASSSSHTETSGDSAPGSAPRVRWGDDVIDNEGLGRKKSKVCCIFRKQRQFGESSSSDDSSSGDEQTYHGTPIGGPNSYEKQPSSQKKKNKKPGHSKPCNHSH
ncbi:Type 1 phosphatases regulator ypi1 [Entomophthora muscae]|uniref:Type 1 phosphatases regulator ypi1 n=1 Tax=Entomophthora muscae TaxID=34485 RepID=A0ACC2TNM1_9FUNG|nr:Type 1 phosphatases regulator ypi1 [Entomophthora muscae]